MKLKSLSFLATEDIIVEITEGTDENGSKNVVDSFQTKARVEQSNTAPIIRNGEKVSASIKLFIFDMFEKFQNETTGYCTVYGEKYDIIKCSKKRNPDGSVNHVVLELI